MRKLTLNLFSQLINFVWLRLTTSIVMLCYVMLCYVMLVLTVAKVATLMHCNLKPPDVAPVVLGFNYEAHTALHQPTTLTIIRNLCESTHISNFSEMEQAAAELCDLHNYVQFGRPPPSWIWPKVDFHNFAGSKDIMHQFNQVSTKSAMRRWLINYSTYFTHSTRFSGDEIVAPFLRDGDWTTTDFEIDQSQALMSLFYISHTTLLHL